MTDVDKLLTEAGERWRAAQPAAPPWTPVPEPRGVTRMRLGSIILAAALATVLAASFGLNAGAPRKAVSHVGIGWNRASLLAAVVHPGDQVSATAVIIVPAGGKPSICLSGASRLMPDDGPVCSPIAVPLEGVDVGRLPGAVLTNGVLESGYVTVHGMWTEGAIAVTSIEPAVPDPMSNTSGNLPCPAPPGGWVSPGGTGSFRTALTPLVKEINTHPDVYGRYWTFPGLNPMNDAGPAVEMVVTKVDPASVRGTVESLFPYSACLLDGDFSAAELSTARSQLIAANASWIVGEFSGEGGRDAPRLAVQLTVLDEAAAMIFAAHPEAYPIPLVVRDPSVDTPTDSIRPVPSVEQTSTPSLEIVDGVPVALDGEPVLVGDAAAAALEGSVDTISILVGGWLHPAQLIACPAIGRADQWNPCTAARLFPSPFDGPEALGIFHGTGAVALSEIPDGMVEAVVLRVHTHDPGCAPSGGCTTSAVLDAVVWQGGLKPTPTPTSSAPPSGRTLSAAVEAATRVAVANGGTSLVATAAVAGPYAVVGATGGDVAGDRWVWAVTVTGTFTAVETCPPGAACPASPQSDLIVLDYVDGSFLISESPALVAPAIADAGSVDVITIVSKFELARALANWDEAWGLLAPMSQKAIGSEATFIELETPYNAAGGGFEIGQIVAGPFDAATTDFIGSVILGDFVRSAGSVSEAHLVYVRHPDEAGASASSSAYLVAFVEGKWRIWIAH